MRHFRQTDPNKKYGYYNDDSSTQNTACLKTMSPRVQKKVDFSILFYDNCRREILSAVANQLIKLKFSSVVS